MPRPDPNQRLTPSLLDRLMGDADPSGRTQILSVAVPVQRYRAVLGVLQLLADSSEIDQSIRQVIDPNAFTWVVVGDGAKVKPQLDRLGIPVEVVQAR